MTPARNLKKGDVILSYGRSEVVKRVVVNGTHVFVRTDHCDHTYAPDKFIRCVKS